MGPYGMVLPSCAVDSLQGHFCSADMDCAALASAGDCEFWMKCWVGVAQGIPFGVWLQVLQEISKQQGHV